MKPDDEYDDGYPKEPLFPFKEFLEEDSNVSTEYQTNNDYMRSRSQRLENKVAFWRAWAIGLGACVLILFVTVFFLLVIVSSP